MSYSCEPCSNKCLLPGDENKSLKQLFQFLKKFQDNPDGTFVQTNLYLGIASQSFLSNFQFRNRNLATNLIYGKILDVADEYVVIESDGECAENKQPYLVLYYEIQSIYSSNIQKYYYQLLSYIENLPEICKCKEDEVYHLIRLLSHTLCDLKHRPDISIVIIYGGIFSMVYPGADVAVARNLLLFKEGYASPMSWIDGYFTVSSKSVAAPVLVVKEGREVQNA